MGTKAVYLFDPITGEYRGIYQAQESPLEPGAYIEPADSTETQPPSAAANEVAVYANGAWALQPDYRGQTIYDQATGSTQEVTEIGAIPTGFALTQPPPTTTQLIAAIDANVQLHLDQAAQRKGYADAAICVSYINSTVAAWATDAKAMNQWRDEAWNQAIAQEAITPLPSVATVLAAIDALTSNPKW